MSNESASIEAIRLARTVFEYIHGNLGLLKFNVEELIPTNGSGGTESKKWDVTCTFFESLGSSAPSRYKASVNLTDKTVIIKKIDGGKEIEEKRFTVTPTPKTPKQTPKSKV